MKCHVCGAQLREVNTDLPFKVDDNSIVIVKELPVLQCENCSEYLMQDQVLEHLDIIMKKLDKAAELEIVRYAA
jgi:YgiT-type zinc finger domain-containing protein